MEKPVLFLDLLQIYEMCRYIASYVALDHLWEVKNKMIYSLRRHFKYRKLTESISLRYQDDFNFRDQIHSLVADPTRQIALNLSSCYNISDVSSLGNVHTLNLSGCGNISDVSSLGNVHTLDLSECENISDVSSLGNVHTWD